MLAYNLLGEKMNYLMIVNKNNKLASNYKPNNLVVVENRKKDKPDLVLLLDKEVYKWFKKLQKDALKEGLDIICDSAYRSYSYQLELLNDMLQKNKDISYLASPGESEHQTGLAVDIAAYRNGEYVDNPELLNEEYTWMFNNAHRFGFILRYPQNKEYVTGYPYEPWHYRYVGNFVAKEIYEKKITLEEYLEKW